MNNIADGAVYSRFDQSVCITEGKGTVKGVIFDLDDTLYSEKEYVRSGFRAVSEYLGTDAYVAKLWKYFVEGIPAIDALLREIGRKGEREACLSIYRNHKPDIHLYDGVEDMFKKLKTKGYKLGIITDGRPKGQRNKIESLGVEKWIDDIIITDQLGGVQFRKPCDIAFRVMQTKWRMHPSEIVYVGDNPVKDFQAPQQLGMKSLWCRNEDGLYKTESNDSIAIMLKNLEEIEQTISGGKKHYGT